MPLLGRHKSLQSQSSKSTATARHQQPSPPLVCESPLFGVRRQLPGASAAPQTEQPASGSSPTTRPLGASISLTHNLASAAGSTRRTGSEKGAQAKQSREEEAKQRLAQQQLELTLGSIPKQITRQQIHYAFSIMDTNADGLIDLRDLSQMLANLGVPIDEAILSHVFMSTASPKRGDHLINESEFLDWIGNFIQVSDLLAPSVGTCDTSAGAKSARGKRTQVGARKSPVGRSSSATTGGGGGSSGSSPSGSLAAHSPEAQYAIEQQLKQRRGSGSGLALMRSLSSSAAAADVADTVDHDQQPGRDELPQLEQLQEARNDLRAAFCVFDLDGDGFITIDEVQQGLKLLGESWSQQELDQVFSKCEGGNGVKLEQPSSKSKSSKSTTGKKQSAGVGGANHPSCKQQISIDDFVKLLL